MGADMDRMRSVEIQARSADEAIRLALEQLGTTRDKVDVQILAETEDDIYGEGEVLVHVELKGNVALPRGDRQQPRNSGGGTRARQTDGRRAIAVRRVSTRKGDAAAGVGRRVHQPARGDRRPMLNHASHRLQLTRQR